MLTFFCLVYTKSDKNMKGELYLMKRFLKFVMLLVVVLVATGTVAYADSALSRVGFAREIMSLYGFPQVSGGASFTDVNPRDAGVVSGAVSMGIVSGIDAQTFAPDQHITLEQAVVMAVRAAGLQPMGAAQASEVLGEQYNDVSPWAAPYFALAVRDFEGLDLHQLSPTQTINASLGQTILRASYNPGRATQAVPGGRTTMEILLAAEDALLGVETYRMSGTMSTIQVTNMGGQQETVNMEMDMSALVQAPASIHIASDIRIAEMPEMAMSSEMLMYNNGLYMRGVGISEDWVRIMDIPAEMADDILRSNNQLLTSDQLMLLDERHMALEGQTVRDGRNAYVVRVSLDNEAVQTFMQDVMQSMAQPLTDMVAGIAVPGEDLSPQEAEELMAIVHEIIENMYMTMDYVYYIDTETMLFIAADFTMDFSIEIVMEGMTLLTEATSTGSFNFYGYGEPVEIPRP